ncbi:sensor histidine kinase [Geomesophilobacter sediminis]|uniref:histidine kinase n=1 Tax=Geomesophilobacter sediminis TaxID=2798584 RepID=A0A8J7JM98_9BACT|nr:ATP-binding protein [Geomesophilobacter sediminis]MBJ6725790.1 hypothetical protein [Geomesophilobacter sediminis]
MKSIRGLLFTALLTGLIAAVALTGMSVYLRVLHELDVVFDYQLKEVAYAATMAHPDQLLLPLPSDSASYEREARLAVQIWKGDQLVYASNPKRPIPKQRQGLTTLYLDDRQPVMGWRVYTLYSKDKMIQVSQPLEARREVGIGMAWRSVRPLIVAAGFLVVLVLVSVSYGLRGLKRVASDISSRSATSLDPIEEAGLPREVVPLVHRINDLLNHLGHAFDAQHRFIADAAHELRTPLAVIQLQAQFLERNTDEKERAEAHRQLKGGVRRASHMVGQLLALARLEPEMGGSADEHLSLDDEAGEVVFDLKPLAEANGVNLALDTDTAWMIGDPEALRALIYNLVDNAIRYTPAGGTVAVTVRPSGVNALLQVTDTGPGIPPAERERVFERFYRLPGTSAGGSGLGLAIVKSALDKLNGTIALSAGEHGNGLKVTVSLPRAGEEPTEAPESG